MLCEHVSGPGHAGLYELSQYAFLADRNGGSGLTWAKLRAPGNGMLQVMAVFAAEWLLLLVAAVYIDQVPASTYICHDNDTLSTGLYSVCGPAVAPSQTGWVSSIISQDGRAFLNALAKAC